MKLLRVATLLASAGAVAATVVAWLAFGVLCEEGCLRRSAPLVSQAVVASLGLVAVGAAVLGAVYGRRRAVITALVVAAFLYAGWGALLAEAT